MSDPDTHPDPAARTERCLAMLERLAAKGLAMAEAIEPDGSKDSAGSFAKVSRAVRLTVTLIMKVQEGARVQSERAKLANTRGAGAVDRYAELTTGKKARVCELVQDVIDRETPDSADYVDLMEGLHERLLEDDAYEHIDDLPLRDIVEHLCADLQLNPDWDRWAGEGWKPNPPFYRPPFSVFNKPSRKPILDDGPDPHPLE